MYNVKTMCPPGYYHSGSIATFAFLANGNRVHLPLSPLSGWAGFWTFLILWGGQKILIFRRGCPNKGELYFLGGSPIHCPSPFINARFKNFLLSVFPLSLICTCFYSFSVCVRGLLFTSQFFCPSILLGGGLTEHSHPKSPKPQKLGGDQKIFIFKGDCPLVGV